MPMLAGASGFLGSSVFSWVRSAIYNRKLYNNMALPTKTAFLSELAKAAARKYSNPCGKAQADAA
jgi:hypothetical protein